MPKRTQIICLHEGERGHSIDGVFINRVLKDLDPAWIRPWRTGVVRTIPCGGRTSVIERMPVELKACLMFGGDTTLMVWADMDDDQPDGDALKERFWQEAKKAGISRPDFNKVVFIFAKDRLENWVEFLNAGATSEGQEGPREHNLKRVAAAASNLAIMCKNRQAADLPSSLQWSCKNWHDLLRRMKD